MLDYSALSALNAVVREGSFERAARALHVTPSAVSQRIRLLEARVGCALLANGTLAELVPGTPLDVPLYWQETRVASVLLDGLSRRVLQAAQAQLQAL